MGWQGDELTLLICFCFDGIKTETNTTDCKLGHLVAPKLAGKLLSCPRTGQGAWLATVDGGLASSPATVDGWLGAWLATLDGWLATRLAAWRAPWLKGWLAGLLAGWLADLAGLLAC